MQVAMLGPPEVRTDDDSGCVLDVGGSRLRSLKVEGVELIAGVVKLPRGRPADPDSEALAVLYALGAMLAIDSSATTDTLAALIPRSHPALER